MNRLKKKFSTKYALALLLFAAGNIYTESRTSNEQQAIQLGATFLKLVDGQSFGITAYILGWLLQIRLNLKYMFYGNQTMEKACVYRGNRYTLKEMALIEIKEEKAFKEILARKSTYDQRTWHNIEKEHADNVAALQESLVQAKDDFAKFMLPFLHNIQPLKMQIVPLIRESCEKRGRADSLLPISVGMADETEVAHFKQHTITYKQLGIFCLDLTHFLTDMVYSCPKARAQFEELRKADAGKQSLIDSTAE